MIQSTKCFWGLLIPLLALSRGFADRKRRTSGSFRIKPWRPSAKKRPSERALDTIYGIIQYNRNTNSREYDRAARSLLANFQSCSIPEAGSRRVSQEWKDKLLPEKGSRATGESRMVG